MKMAIAAVAGLLLAGTYGASPAQAQWGPGYSTQTNPAPRYEQRRGEPGVGSEMRERCAGLRREWRRARQREDQTQSQPERARSDEGACREHGVSPCLCLPTRVGSPSVAGRLPQALVINAVPIHLSREYAMRHPSDQSRSRCEAP